MLNKVKQLISGSPLIDAQGQLLYLKGIVLGSLSETINEGQDYDLEEFMELSEWENPLASQLKEKDEIIKRLTANLAKANEPTVRAKATHMSKQEIREIELIMINNPEISNMDIVRAHGSSQPVISRIRNGKHTKSSEAFKALVLKRNLDV